MAKFGSDYSALAHHYIYNNDYSECYGYRMYSENEKLFSYGSHFQMARKIEHKGKKVIFVTNHTASNTTAKQIYALRQAIPFDWKVYNVDSMTNHKSNISGWFRKIEYFAQKLPRAKSRKDEYKREIKQLIATIVEYKEFFDVKYRFNKAEQQIIDDVDFDELQDLLKDREKRMYRSEKAKVKRQTEKAFREAKEELEKWLKGETKYLRKQPYNAPIYLRINTDNETVETSQGITVPKRECKILFTRIEQGKDVKGFVLDELYTVLRHTEDELIVGCHIIPMKEVKRIGALL